MLRATETREESTPAFEQVKEQVRTAYVNSESAKAAMEQAKKLLAELQKGGKPELAWSEKETLSAVGRTVAPVSPGIGRAGKSTPDRRKTRLRAAGRTACATVGGSLVVKSAESRCG